MEWTGDVAAGEWIRERLDDDFSLHGVVPRGFEAYARVFHPVPRDRPDGSEPHAVTWGETAAAFGTTMHALAQWHRIIRGTDSPEHGGWRWNDPDTGNLAPDVLAAVARHLVDHTATPDAGYAGVWVGWGVPHILHAVRDTFADDLTIARGSDETPAFARSSAKSPTDGKPALRLPGREHALVRAAPREWADPAWPERVPWRDGWDQQSPSLIWPDGREWAVVTEVDFDSTIVAGPAALVRAICTDPAIEALPIREGTDLTWDADDVNRPSETG